MLDSTQGAERSATYSLLEPLPSDAVRRPVGSLGDYGNYPVFSLPWLKRRSLIFVPCAVGVALLETTLATVPLHSWRMTGLVLMLDVPLWVLIVAGGPALATLVRHRRWPIQWERVAVVAAVGLGIALCIAATRLINASLLPYYRAALGEWFQKLPQPTALQTVVVTVYQLTFFACLGGGLSLRTYFGEPMRWSQVREMQLLRRQNGEADLKVAVLQAQVEPHFLFNTLACLHSLIRQDPERAQATVAALVDHLRATIPKLRAGIGQSYSTLGEQIEVCESYLRVMQVRMGARLGYALDVPESLLGHPFPPLMLISLVENAIKHGLEPSPGGGNISLFAEVEDRGVTRQLAVSVIDNGVGLKPGISGGVGLENIRAQLAVRFGGYGELYVRARAAGGVAATIRVPSVGGTA